MLLTATFINKPNEIIIESMAVPPYDISGRGTPTIGIKPDIIAVLTITYKKRFIDTPMDSILPKVFLLLKLIK